MVKPTPEEVTKYARKIGFLLDGHAFCDYYESKGWFVGKSPMKVWQAAVRTWKNKQIIEGRFIPIKPSQPPTDPSKMEEATMKMRELMDKEWERRQRKKAA